MSLFNKTPFDNTQLEAEIELIKNQLRSIQDPDLKRDIISLEMIKELKVRKYKEEVELTLVLFTPADPYERMFTDSIITLLSQMGYQKIDLKVSSQIKSVHRSKATASIPGVKHLIAVSSGKGGVGKSTVSVNLAVSLALRGAKVGLMDTDIYGPNIPTMMGVTEQPKLTKDSKGNEIFVPPSSHGVKVMSMGMLVDPDQAMIWRGPMLHSIVNQFCLQVEWGDLDYLIIDMPPGTGDVQLSLAQLVPLTGVVLVTTPQEVSLQDVRKAYAMWDKVKVPVLGIVENMSYFKPDEIDRKYYLFGQGGGKLLAEKFKTDLLAELPIVPQVREGGDSGRPLSVNYPEHEQSKLFMQMSGKIARKVALMAEEGIDPAHLVQIGKF